MSCEREYITNAAAALDDNYASQLRVCIQVLKFESDRDRRRVAAERLAALESQTDRSAA